VAKNGKTNFLVRNCEGVFAAAQIPPPDGGSTPPLLPCLGW